MTVPWTNPQDRVHGYPTPIGRYLPMHHGLQPNDAARGGILARMRFRATLLLAGKTATGIRVPAEVVESLGKGKRPPVRVTINGHTYRSTVAVRGGEFMLPVSAEQREGAGVAACDEVDVDVELDTEPRELTLSPDFAGALDRYEDAKRYFEGLSYSNKRRFVLSIEGAKTAETRQRRIDKAVGMLREGRT